MAAAPTPVAIPDYRLRLRFDAPSIEGSANRPRAKSYHQNPWRSAFRASTPITTKMSRRFGSSTVAHNVAKLERHGNRDVCVHRKGATRAFPAGSSEIPEEYCNVGQPVFIPGSMGTASYVLAGEAGAMQHSFGTTCHGAGRQLSRTAARKQITGAELRRQLEERGIIVRCPSNKGLAEEAPFAYKDVEQVVNVVERAGLARRVASLAPLGVVKG